MKLSIVLLLGSLHVLNCVDIGRYKKWRLEVVLFNTLHALLLFSFVFYILQVLRCNELALLNAS